MCENVVIKIYRRAGEKRYQGYPSVCCGAGRGVFSLCDPAVTPAWGQLFAVSPRPV